MKHHEVTDDWRYWRDGVLSAVRPPIRARGLGTMAVHDRSSKVQEVF